MMTKAIIAATLAASVLVAGCSAAPGGTVAGPGAGATGAMPASINQDIPLTTADGKSTTLAAVRQPVLILGFVNQPMATNQANAELLTLANRYGGKPVTVAQVTEPANGAQPASWSATAKDSQLMMIGDANRAAWEACGRPTPGTVLLINGQGDIVDRAYLGNLSSLIETADSMAQAAQGRQWTKPYPP